MDDELLFTEALLFFTQLTNKNVQYSVTIGIDIISTIFFKD